MLIVLLLFMVTLIAWLYFSPKPPLKKGKILLFNFLLWAGYTLFLLIMLYRIDPSQQGEGLNGILQNIFGEVQMAKDIALSIGFKVAEATIFIFKELVLIAVHMLAFWACILWELWKQKPITAS